MASAPEVNVEQIMAEIRRRAQARREKAGPACAPPPAPATPLFDQYSRPAMHEIGMLRHDVAAATMLQPAVGALNPRRSGLHNKVIQLGKKTLGRSLSWYTRSLQEFGAAVVRALNQTVAALEAVQAAVSGQEDRVSDLEHRLSGLEDRLRVDERDLRRALHLLQEEGKAAAGGGPAAPAPMFTGHAQQALDFDYFLFEEQFRGPEKAIRQRQQQYVGYFQGREKIVDLGCGRGEFLGLLRAAGVEAQGVESSADMFLLCRNKGFDVVQKDILSFLQEQPDESLGGIFCSQVMEHLPADLQIKLVNLAHLKLRSGSPLVIETINPECIYALARNFFLDPTHVRPVHPEMLAFLMRSLHFERVELKYSSPVDSGPLPRLSFAQPPPELDQFNRALEHANRLLFGFQDYSAVGWR
jgi:SAM-dependent methyltransferase